MRGRGSGGRRCTGCTPRPPLLQPCPPYRAARHVRTCSSSPSASSHRPMRIWQAARLLCSRTVQLNLSPSSCGGWMGMDGYRGGGGWELVGCRQPGAAGGRRAGRQHSTTHPTIPHHAVPGRCKRPPAPWPRPAARQHIGTACVGDERVRCTTTGGGMPSTGPAAPRSGPAPTRRPHLRQPHPGRRQLGQRGVVVHHAHALGLLLSQVWPVHRQIDMHTQRHSAGGGQGPGPGAGGRRGVSGTAHQHTRPRMRVRDQSGSPRARRIGNGSCRRRAAPCVPSASSPSRPPPLTSPGCLRCGTRAAPLRGCPPGRAGGPL